MAVFDTLTVVGIAAVIAATAFVILTCLREGCSRNSP
jgi:hypothetical protein